MLDVDACGRSRSDRRRVFSTVCVVAGLCSIPQEAGMLCEQDLMHEICLPVVANPQPPAEGFKAQTVCGQDWNIGWENTNSGGDH